MLIFEENRKMIARIRRVIKSCRTKHHLQSCNIWIKDLMDRDLLGMDEYAYCLRVLEKRCMECIQRKI